MHEYLDLAGLAYLWGKLKNKFASLDSNGKVPTSQLPDGLPATIADGSITEAKLATAVQTKLNKELLIEDVEVNITYAAGSIGTRGVAQTVGSASKTGYTLGGVFIYKHQNSGTFNAMIGRNYSTDNIYVAAYRATGNAASNLPITLRFLWIPD